MACRNKSYLMYKSGCIGGMRPVTYSFIRTFTKKASPMHRVVVTGLGIVCPLGVGVQTSWNNLLQGKSGASKITDPRFDKIGSKVACFVPQDDKLDAMLKKEKTRMSVSMVHGLCAAEEALQDAGWQPCSENDKERTGVSVGMGMVDLDYIGGCHEEVVGGRHKKVSPYFVPRILPNLSAGYISIAHNLMGPNLSCSTACATASHAIADAFRLIERGDCDVMVAGGVDSCINPLAYTGFSRARALSTKFNETPEVASRPFDKDRDGFVMGEGAGILILESLEHARKRGSKIYCELFGYGMSGDADHITAARQDGKGALLAMKQAFKALPDHSIDKLWQINTHATSTPRGDAAELGAISSLLADTSASPYVTANKGSIGHLLGAAGGVESAFAVLSIKEGKIPPTINISNLDTDIVKNINIVQKTEFTPPNLSDYDQTFPKRLVLKNSFGFGGTNISLLFGMCDEE